MNSAPTFGREVLRIAPADVYIPTRLGLYFPDKAAALGRLMAIHGQRTPITVRKSSAKIVAQGQPWTLVTGMHRLNGAMIEELAEIVALERIGGNANDALDEEASENLDRRDQPPLERAIFIHATGAAARTRLAYLAAKDDENGEGTTLTISGQELNFLSRTSKSLAEAKKVTNAEARQIRKEATEKATKEAAENATKAARAKGLSKDTVDAIRFAVLGSDS